MRRILIVSFIILIVGGAIFYFQKDNASGNKEDTSVPQRIFQNLFNRQDNEGGGGETTQEGQPQESVLQGDPRVRFKQISPTAIAGYTVFNIKTKASSEVPETLEPVVRYVGRANGYVYEIKGENVPLQISNIFIPNIYEAFFQTEKNVVVRFLREDERTIASYTIPIPDQNPDGTRTQKNGVYFQEDIKQITFSNDKKTVGRVTIENGSAVVSTTDALGGSKKELVRSPFQSWILLFGDTFYLQTKAAASAPGFLYKIDPVYKRLIRVLGDIQGLTSIVSPKGDYVIYSESTPEGFVSKIFNTKQGDVKQLPVSILPEKCTWLKDETLICAGNDYVTPGTYPDDWYLGTVSFSDKLYRILPISGIVETLDAGDVYRYDATQLSVNEEQKILYFIDKQTGILWSFDYL